MGVGPEEDFPFLGHPLIIAGVENELELSLPSRELRSFYKIPSLDVERVVKPEGEVNLCRIVINVRLARLRHDDRPSAGFSGKPKNEVGTDLALERLTLGNPALHHDCGPLPARHAPAKVVSGGRSAEPEGGNEQNSEATRLHDRL